MLVKLIIKLFRPSKRTAHFDPKIEEMNRDLRLKAIKSCGANDKQAWALFTGRKPYQWRQQYDQRPQPPVIDTLPLRLQAENIQVQQQLPRPHFLRPTTTSHPTSLANLQLLKNTPSHECANDSNQPVTRLDICRRNPESFAHRDCDPTQAAPSTEILRRKAPRRQLANMGESSCREPSALFKVDEPIPQRCEAKEIMRMKREVRATISLLLRQLQYQGYSELVRQKSFHEF